MVVFTGTKRSRPTSIVRESSKTSIAAPIAVSIWMTSGLFGVGGVDVLLVADQRQAEDAVAPARARARMRSRSNQRLLVEVNLCRSRSPSASRSAFGGLRGLAQDDAAVGLAAGEVATLAVGLGTAHRLDRERRTGLGEPAGDAGIGHRTEVVGVRDERVAVAGVDQLVEQAGAASARCRGHRARADTTRVDGSRGQPTGIRSSTRSLGSLFCRNSSGSPSTARSS